VVSRRKPVQTVGRTVVNQAPETAPAVNNALKPVQTVGRTVVNQAPETAPAVNNALKPAKDAVDDIVMSAKDIATKYKIKKYVTSDGISKIDGLAYKDGKLYSGKEIVPGDLLAPTCVNKYKNGRLVSSHELWDYSDKVLTMYSKGKELQCRYNIDKNGKLKILNKSNKKIITNIADKYDKPEYYRAKSIGELPAHKYTDVPDIGVRSRTADIDFWDYSPSLRAIKPNYISAKMSSNINFNQGGVVLIAGKSTDGRKVVFLQSPAGRIDYHGRQCRNLVTLTSKNGDFSPAQLDLIKAVAGKSHEQLMKEMPLARAISVKMNDEGKEIIATDIDVLLREVAHWSKGRNLSSAASDALAKLENMPNDSYIRLS